MLDTDTTKAPHAYIRRAGEGRCLNVAGQLIYLLAGESDTAGGFGAVICEATEDRGPIPRHFHEREHDTWLCTRGRLRVWFDDQCRTLTEGDFAYVPPYGVHSYQSVAPRTQFFGIVAPGGWEQFFVDAGEEWSRACLPALDHPFDFSRMRPAMMTHDVHPVPEQNYCEPSQNDVSDRNLPEGAQAYALQSGYGPRHRLNGHLATQILSHANSAGTLDMRVIEGGRGAAMPALLHDRSHVLLYVLEGAIRLTLNGEEHLIARGDTANIPAGTAYATEILSAQARWVLSSAHGDGLSVWNLAGETTPEFIFDDRCDGQACAERIGGIAEGDFRLA